MKKIILFLLVMCMSMLILDACSNRESSPTAPEPSRCLVQPHSLNKASKDYTYSEWIFVGDPDGPQPANFGVGNWIPGGSLDSPQPIDKSLWYGDCVEDVHYGIPDTWTAWNCTIDRSDLGGNCLYSEAGSESEPTSCMKMTIQGELYWRPYPFTGKWKLYAYHPGLTVYDQRGAIISGTFCYSDAWESRCWSFHTFHDPTNRPDTTWFTQLKSQFRSLSPEKAIQ